MSWGKTKKDIRENGLADILVMIGAYQEYVNSMVVEEDFETFYLANRNYKKYMYQSKANRMINEELLKQGIHIFNRTSKKFYRINRRRGVKISGKVGNYFVCVMDYVMDNNVLADILFKDILNNCRNYSREINNKEIYTQCFNVLLDFQIKTLAKVEKEYNDSENNPSNRMKKAKKSIDIIRAYSGKENFRIKCRQYKA